MAPSSDQAPVAAAESGGANAWRLKIEGLYKVFTPQPEAAMRMLAAGASKLRVLEELGVVVGLNNVSLSVSAGATYVIMGLSGSGKSTLARCINRLNEPTAGRILLDGQDIVPLSEAELRQVRRTRMSMVFQHFALLPNKRVLENVEFGLKLRGVAPAVRRRRAEEVLTVVGLTRWGNHYPHELSGGMRQRVGLARALATDADVLIMDEAFSALDPLIRNEMQEELLRLQQSLHKTIVFITHDFQEALKIGNRIAIMADGEVVREGTPQSIVMEPGSEYVAAFTREVDRARLFDARSVMRPVERLAELSDTIVVRAAGDEAAPGFVLDKAGKVVGTLSPEAIRGASAAGRLEAAPSVDVARVPETARLVDIAGTYREGLPMAVVDGMGRLVGVLAAEQVLTRIGARPAVQPTGGGGRSVQGR